MRRQFESRAQVDDYLAHDRIECLECGNRFQFLGSHLRLAHAMNAAEYRDAWGLPSGTALAGLLYRAAHTEKIRRMQAAGSIDYSHLPDATQASRSAARTRKSTMDTIAHAERMRKLRPGDHSRLPAGATRSGGRDADRAREYQQAYRSKTRGDSGPMARYRKKYA